MPDYKLGFKGAYIAAVEFGGRQPTLTIESVKLESIADEKGKTRDRWVARFAGMSRGWIVNLTNAQLMAAMWGRNTDDWAGHLVTLGAERVNFGAEKVDGIRVVGSPEIKEPITVEVKLPRRKPGRVTLIPTGKGPAPDPETGEVKA